MKQLIKHLTETLDKPEQSRLQTYFKEVKFISMSSEEEAYFLGIILRTAVKSEELDPHLERKIYNLIKRFQFIEFYEHKKKPDFDNLPLTFNLVMIIMGFMATVAGINMLISNGYLITNNSRIFGSFTSGGLMSLFGLLFLIGGLLKVIQRYKQSKYRSVLLK